MAKEPEGEDVLDTEKMSEKEMLLKIIELSSREGITDGELRRILATVIEITSEPG
jgi:hypothetical protein